MTELGLVGLQLRTSPGVATARSGYRQPIPPVIVVRCCQLKVEEHPWEWTTKTINMQVARMGTMLNTMSEAFLRLKRREESMSHNGPRL